MSTNPVEMSTEAIICALTARSHQRAAELVYQLIVDMGTANAAGAIHALIALQEDDS